MTTAARIDLPKMMQGATYEIVVTLTDSAGDAIDLTGKTVRLQLLSNDQPGADLDTLDNAGNGGIVVADNVLTVTVTAAQTADFVPRQVQGRTKQGVPIGYVPYTLVLINADSTIDPVLEGRIPVTRGLDVATGAGP